MLTQIYCTTVRYSIMPKQEIFVLGPVKLSRSLPLDRCRIIYNCWDCSRSGVKFRQLAQLTRDIYVHHLFKTASTHQTASRYQLHFNMCTHLNMTVCHDPAAWTTSLYPRCIGAYLPLDKTLSGSPWWLQRRSRADGYRGDHALYGKRQILRLILRNVRKPENVRTIGL